MADLSTITNAFTTLEFHVIAGPSFLGDTCTTTTADLPTQVGQVDEKLAARLCKNPYISIPNGGTFTSIARDAQILQSQKIFLLFPNLPREIRAMIWVFALQNAESRVLTAVEILDPQDHSGSHIFVLHGARAPAVMQSCKEAVQDFHVYPQGYTKTFALKTDPREHWFHPAKDILRIAHDLPERIHPYLIFAHCLVWYGDIDDVQNLRVDASHLALRWLSENAGEMMNLCVGTLTITSQIQDVNRVNELLISVGLEDFEGIRESLREVYQMPNATVLERGDAVDAISSQLVSKGEIKYFKWLISQLSWLHRCQPMIPSPTKVHLKFSPQSCPLPREGTGVFREEGSYYQAPSLDHYPRIGRRRPSGARQ